MALPDPRGARALAVRLAGIEGGIECAKLAPRLSALADGEASAEDLTALRPHMKSCLSCRAALREFRTMPDPVASVVPTAALVAVDGDGPLRSLAESALAAAQQKLESAVGAAQSKTAAMGERLHAAAELATGQKVAAVAASTAALAGGGAAIDEFANHHMRPQALQVQEPEAQPVKEELPVVPTAPPPAETPPADSAPVPAPAPAPEPPPPPPDPATEFAPGASATPAPSKPSAPAQASTQPAGGEFSSSGGGGGGGGGAGEFAP